MVERYGFVLGVRFVYWLVALLSLVAATVRAMWLKETLKTNASPGNVMSELKRSVVEVFAAFRGMTKPLAVLTLVLLISSFEEPMFHSFMSLYAVDVAGISKPNWALLNIIYIIVPLVAGIPLGRLVDVVGRKKALLAAYVLWVPSIAYFIYCKSLVWMVLIFVIFTLGGSLFGPAYQALLADLTPKEMRGRVMGVVGTLNLLAMIPASAVGVCFMS
ncbi:MAG: MFS transporter [Thermoproteales archaeon]|nr:MFS transporter [Thermoproteales archaeon]